MLGALMALSARAEPAVVMSWDQDLAFDYDRENHQRLLTDIVQRGYSLVSADLGLTQRPPIRAAPGCPNAVAGIGSGRSNASKISRLNTELGGRAKLRPPPPAAGHSAPRCAARSLDAATARVRHPLGRKERIHNMHPRLRRGIAPVAGFAFMLATGTAFAQELKGNAITSIQVAPTGDGVEIAVTSSTPFIRSELPVLRVGDQDLTLSSAPDDGSLNTRRFWMSWEQFQKARSGERVLFQWGRGTNEQPVDFGNLDKSKLAR